GDAPRRGSAAPPRGGDASTRGRSSAIRGGDNALRVIAAAIAFLTLIAVPPTTPWRLVGAAPLALGRTPVTPTFFAVGASATVAVTVEGGLFKLRINGLPEGAIVPAGQDQQ